MVELFQALDDHIPHDTGGNFFAAHFLQFGFDLADQVVDLGGRDRALGAGEADALEELIAVKFLARAGLFDDERDGEDGALIGGKTLTALLTFTAAAYPAAVVVGGIEHLRTFVLAIRTAQLTLLAIRYTKICPCGYS